MSIKRSVAYCLLSTVTVISLIIIATHHFFEKYGFWINIEFHSTIEAFGGLIAVIMAAILIQKSYDENNARYLPIAFGLLGMGFLDGLHAAIRPGNVFVFLHSLAGLIGGLGFVIAWMPESIKASFLKKNTRLWILPSAAFLTGFVVLVFPKTVPVMISENRFTFTAMAIHIAAAIFFLFAAFRFVFEFHRFGKIEDFLFAALALLFGMAGLTFTSSVIWNIEWWVWHMLRLSAYLTALGLLFYQYSRMVLNFRISLAELAKTEKELIQYQNHLEDLVTRRTAKLDIANRLLQKEILDRKEAQREIKQSTRFLQTVIDGIPESLMVIDRDFRIQLANKTVIELAGRNDLVASGLKCHQISHHKDMPCKGKDHPCPVQEVISSKSPVTETHIHYTSRRKMIWVEVTAAPILDRHGNVVQIIESCRNITEQKKYEEELKKHREKLEEQIERRTSELKKANQSLEMTNRELESFSYSVSHDLRAPLRAINGFANIIIQDFGDMLNKEGRRLLNVISSNAQKMGILIDDLLSFSRFGRQQMKMAVIDMNHLANEVVKEIRSIPGNQMIVINTQSLSRIRGDRSLIRQVLINLISNAVKFTKLCKEAVIKIGEKSINGEVIFYIQDNGVGFDMKYKDKLFGVFQRLHCPDEFEGTGVGLALVQRIIHRHGGRVWAEGKQGKGATFYFALPDEQNQKVR